MKAALAMAVVLALASLAGCEREKRRLSKPPESLAALYDERNAYDISQGKRLFRWYNCSGCHANGGGGMGPALMDAGWRYGHEPQQIFQTIMDGRPNGMPAFRGRVTEEHAWQLVAFVRSLIGHVPNASMSGRNDTLSAGQPEQRRHPQEPRPEPPPKP
jgi:cytochrome c oxidase cbb3-type subunit 3